MQIIVKKLILENFRDISQTFEFNAGRNRFSGPNGCGKTTVFDSITWLVDDKDSMGNKKFAIKTIRDRVPMSRAKHSVFGCFDVDGGKEFRFGKVFAEKWVKNRKDGNQISYYIDGMDVESAVKVSRTKYVAAILEAFGPNYRLATDPHFLPEMHWKERRAILEKMTASIDREAIIDGISGLRDMLVQTDEEGKAIGSRSVEDQKTFVDQRLKKIGDDLIEINAGITANSGIVENAGGLSGNEPQKAVDDAKLKVSEAKLKINDFETGDRSGESGELKILNADLFNLRKSFQETKAEANERNQKRINDIRVIDQEIKNHGQDLDDHRSMRAKLLAEYKALNSKTPDGHPCIHYNESCPYFGTEITAEVLADSNENFNSIRAEGIRENIARGKDVAKEIKLIEGYLKELSGQKTALEEMLPPKILGLDADPAEAALNEKIQALGSQAQAKEVPIELTAALVLAEDRLEIAQNQRASISAVSESQTKADDLRRKKTRLSGEADGLNAFLVRFEDYNNKVSDATEAPINALFSLVNFKMFVTQENGVIAPCCDVFDNDMRPWNGAMSTGEKIGAGLDMLKTCSKFYGVRGPVFIDNIESFTGVIDLDCQHIELRADEGL